MSRLGLAGLLVVALVGSAGANGRPPQTSSIHFRQGHETDIVAGMSFGLVTSHDGGATWQWMCEKSVGYGGMYDPIYAYSTTGALFATTFDGLKVNRDTCTFAATPPGTTFASTNTLGPDHAFYYAAADPADAKVYKSTDDGMTFPQSAAPGQNNDWWDSIMVAKQDAQRVYLSGYRLLKRCNAASTNAGSICSLEADCLGPKCDAGNSCATCDAAKDILLFQSTNGGASFTPLPGAGFTRSINSVVDFVGVSPANENVVYVRVSVENGNVGDGIYKLTVGTDIQWSRILGKLDSIAFLVRANGDLVASTLTQGTVVSNNGGTSWTPVANAPHINCLAENAAGEVWACTHNYDVNQIPSDGFGIMKTTDLSSWTGVFKYQDITAPVMCPGNATTKMPSDAGTVQETVCASQVWCGLTQQLGITATPLVCPLSTDTPPDGVTVNPGKKGCCDATGGGGPAALALSIAVGLLLLRKRQSSRRLTTR